MGFLGTNAIATGLRFCGQAIVMAVFGKLVGVTADQAIKEAPHVVGAWRYRVTFRADTPDGPVEREAHFPFYWLARFFCWVEYRRHVRRDPPRTVFSDGYSTITC